MDAEISKLEADLLNLRDAKQPLVDRFDAIVREHAAELSKKLSDIPGTKMVTVCAMRYEESTNYHDNGICLYGSFARIEDAAQIAEVCKSLDAKYGPKRVPIKSRLSVQDKNEKDLLSGLVKFTEISPIREDKKDDHAHIFVVRQPIVYTRMLIYDLGLALSDPLPITPEIMEKFKQIGKCNTYEVTNPSRLAEVVGMFDYATKYIVEKRKESSKVKK